MADDLDEDRQENPLIENGIVVWFQERIFESVIGRNRTARLPRASLTAARLILPKAKLRRTRTYFTRKPACPHVTLHSFLPYATSGTFCRIAQTATAPMPERNASHPATENRARAAEVSRGQGSLVHEERGGGNKIKFTCSWLE